MKGCLLKAENNTVVTISYQLKDDEGRLIDETPDNEFFSFVQGAGFILPTLEQELIKLQKGDSFEVSLTPEQAYGEYDKKLIKRAEKEQFASIPNLQAGMQLQAVTDKGMMIISVVEVHDDHVVVDENHPLAGLNLIYQGQIIDVRVATEDEVAKGFVDKPVSYKH